MFSPEFHVGGIRRLARRSLKKKPRYGNPEATRACGVKGSFPLEKMMFTHDPSMGKQKVPCIFTEYMNFATVFFLLWGSSSR